MNAFTNALAGCNKTLDINADASRHDMYYMNWYDPEHIVPDKDLRSVTDSINKANIHPERFMSSIRPRWQSLLAGYADESERTWSIGQGN